MESYRTEEEQLEALRRWWNENGRSTVVAVVMALAGTFGWQSWQASREENRERASDVYQAMMRAIDAQGADAVAGEGVDLANQLKRDYSGTTYAQFAALHLAAIAVNSGNLSDAEEQLRWVLGKAAKDSDTAQVAQLRLARVLAAAGDIDQALAIIDGAGESAYRAAYAVAKGDVLLGAGRPDEAREAYTRAIALAAGDAGAGAVNLPVLQQKIQALSPVPGRNPDAASGAQSQGGVGNSDVVTDAQEE